MSYCSFSWYLSKNTLVLFRRYNNNHGNSDNDVDSDNQEVIVMITVITKMIIMM